MDQHLWSVSPPPFSWFPFLCLSEIFHIVTKLYGISSWIFPGSPLLGDSFLGSSRVDNSFVLVYNWLPSHRGLLQSIFQSVTDFLAPFSGFPETCTFLLFLFPVLWNKVIKERYPSRHCDVFILSRTLT